jgi:argininosuccinate synthase
MHDRDKLAPRFAELVYNGFWFSPEMEFLRSAVEVSQANVTGEARVKLYKGGVQITGRRSPVSLYSEQLVTFEADEGAYDQADATGFIRLQGLRLATARRSG